MQQGNQNSLNGSVSLTANESQEVSEWKHNSERVVISFTNLETSGGTTCYLAVGAEAVINKGIPIQPGQSVTFSKDSGYTPSQKQYSLIAAANMDVAIYEEVL